MKDTLLNIIEDYLVLYPNEKERQSKFIDFLNNYDSDEVINWNNFDGHVVASGFVYAKKEQRFLVIFHKDLRMYLYPGGHVDMGDTNIFKAAKREVYEETGIYDLDEVYLSDKMIPIDIDTQVIPYNERLKLPSHLHFDFRYLFTVDRVQIIKMDLSESSEYKWISIDECREFFGEVVDKIIKLINEEK